MLYIYSICNKLTFIFYIILLLFSVLQYFLDPPCELLFSEYEVSPSLDAVPNAFDCRAKGFWELATGSKNCGGFPR
jgi:hypothetical protein